LILGDPALRLLARLKLRGLVRKRLRRMKRPASAAFALLGLVLIASWLGMMIVQRGSRGPGLSGDELAVALRTGALVLTFMTCTSALTHRGLYLPKAEIELLLAAPVSRRDLVRYRMLSSLGRTLFGSLFLGVLVARAVPNPITGFIGGFAATLFLPVIGQGVSLIAGGAENRLVAGISRLPLRWINLLLLFLLVLVFAFAFSDGNVGERLRALGVHGSPRELLTHPLVVAAGMPFVTWVKMMVAADLPTFATWFALNAVLWVVLFELVARIPVDFRELSLATSADIARRLNRYRRGGAGVSSWRFSERAARRRIPWLFGRGPFGAIAWRKSCSILRKARGTLFTGAAIVGLLTFVSIFIARDAADSSTSAIVGPVLIALVGTIYLCGGLRFDFREDLDQMESIKSWPMAPWKLFLATLLPEVCLVSIFVAAGIGLRLALTGEAHPAQIAVLLSVPLVVVLWTSIDNALFLYAPIRFTPGQEGALHHTGRALTLMLLRMVFLALVFAGLLGAMAVSLLLDMALGLSELAVQVAALGLGALALGLEIAALLWMGGRLFRRFDVARDTG